MKTAVDMQASGATPRQIYTWTEQGWLKPRQDGKVGSGRSYTYDDSELVVCERMARLTAGGITARVAADIARQAGDLVEVAPQVYVLVLDDRQAVPRLEVFYLGLVSDEEARGEG
jgi:DNA-binding transcriptional MerR regulator